VVFSLIVLKHNGVPLLKSTCLPNFTASHPTRPLS